MPFGTQHVFHLQLLLEKRQTVLTASLPFLRADLRGFLQTSAAHQTSISGDLWTKIQRQHQPHTAALKVKHLHSNLADLLPSMSKSADGSDRTLSCRCFRFPKLHPTVMVKNVRSCV